MSHPSGQVQGFVDAGAEDALVHAVFAEGILVGLSVETLPSRVARLSNAALSTSQKLMTATPDSK